MADVVERAVETDLASFRPDSLPPFARIEARSAARARRRRRAAALSAVLVPATAATTALAAVLAGGALRDPAPERPADRATPPPPRGEHVLASRDGALVVVTADDVRGPAAYTVPVARQDVRAVAAVGDGATFYVAQRAAGCRSTILRVTADGATTLGTVDVDVASLAVTRDGSTLAYYGSEVVRGGREVTAASRAGVPPACRGQAFLRVRDLATGSEREWRRPNRPRDMHDGPSVPMTGLTWAPDNRRLAAQDPLEQAIVELDTGAAGSPWDGATLPHPVPPLPDSPPGERCAATTPAYLPDGTLTALVKCVPARKDTPRSDWFVRSRVAVYDAATRRVGRTVLAFRRDFIPAWVDFDDTGERAFVGGVRYAALQIGPIDPRHDLGAVEKRMNDGRILYRWNGKQLRALARGHRAAERIWW